MGNWSGKRKLKRKKSLADHREAQTAAPVAATPHEAPVVAQAVSASRRVDAAISRHRFAARAEDPPRDSTPSPVAESPSPNRGQRLLDRFQALPPAYRFGAIGVVSLVLVVLVYRFMLAPDTAASGPLPVPPIPAAVAPSVLQPAVEPVPSAAPVPPIAGSASAGSEAASAVLPAPSASAPKTKVPHLPKRPAVPGPKPAALDEPY